MRFLVNPEQPPYHPIALMTAVLTFYLGLLHPRGNYILFPLQRIRQWENIFRRLAQNRHYPSLVLPSWCRVLFLLARRTNHSLHWLPGLNNITIKNHYPLPLISSAFERLRFWEMLITWSGYEKETNGRRHLILLKITMNTYSCHSDSPMLQLFSKLFSKMSFVSTLTILFVYLDDI